MAEEIAADHPDLRPPEPALPGRSRRPSELRNTVARAAAGGHSSASPATETASPFLTEVVLFKSRSKTDKDRCDVQTAESVLTPNSADGSKTPWNTVTRAHPTCVPG